MNSSEQTRPSDVFWRAPRPAQQHRFEQILTTTIEIAREGGYEAVQMRSVAQRSGVSLGTAYTYFQSRDNLVYRAMLAWQARQFEETVGGEARNFAELESAITQLLGSFQAEPRLMEAFIKATLSSDPYVLAHHQQFDFGWWTKVQPVFAVLEPDLAELAPRMFTDVFYANAVRWAYGQIEFAEILSHLLDIIRLVSQASEALGSAEIA